MANAPDDPEQDLITSFVVRAFRASAEFAEWYTCPIVMGKDPNTIVFDRTGVLLAIADLKFLITARHDFNEALDAGYYPFVATFRQGQPCVPLQFKKMIRLPEDRGDVAVIVLDEETASSLLEDYRFLNISDLISMNDRRHENASYVITGFPKALEGQDEIGLNRIDIFRHIGLQFQGDRSLVENYDPRLHLLIEYQRDNKNVRTGKIVHPFGMSGCGVWYVCNPGNIDKFTAQNLRLAGIQTGWHSQYEYAKATWIDVVLGMIWKECSDARSPMRIHGINF